MDDRSLNRNSATPLHIQFAERMRRLIISGAYEPGRKLDTEKELGDRLGLSRVTVRSGLALLEREGWIVKRRGLGSFVRNAIEQDLSQVQTTSDVMRATGLAPNVRTIRFGPVMPPLAVAKALASPPMQPLLGIDKLYVDEQSPIALVRCFLPANVQDAMDLIRSQPSVTTITIWEETLGVKIKGAQHHIRAEPATGEVADALDVEPGTPLLVLDRITYAEDGRALESVVSFYSWSRYTFSIALPRIRMDELGLAIR